MSFTMFSVVLVFAILGFTQATVNNFLYGGWESPRGGVVKDTLFLEGGLMSAQDGSINTHPFGVFYELPFCAAFDISTDDTNKILRPVNETLNGDASVMVDGYLFADNDEFYTYGGRAYPTADDSSSYIFHAGLQQPNPDASYWVPSLDTHFKLDGVSGYVTNGAGVSVPSESLGFYFSGMRSASGGNLSYLSGTDDKADTLSEYFIQVDMSTYENPKWSSLKWPSSVPARADASMVWIPVSKQGILIVIGGLVEPADLFAYSLNDTQKQESLSTSPEFLTQIAVYDIAGENWYLQNTTGTSPSQLGQFCTVVTSAEDDTSHQIYVYGGWNGVNGGDQQASDEVWVLSVPSFKWIKVTDGTPNHRRRSHFCTSPAPNQMISVGGVDEVGGPLQSSLIDFFDLNSLTWTGNYDPQSWAEYKVPSEIDKAIRNSDGSALFAENMDLNLASLFRTPYSKQIVPGYPYTSCGSIKPSNSNSSPPAWRSAVIGAVVGVVVLAIAGLLAWCCYRRRRRAHRTEYMSESSHNHGFISRWVHGTQHSATGAPKSYFSETTTEVGDPMSPPLAHEADGYFKPRAELPLNPAAPQTGTDQFAPFGFRSPRIPQDGSAEVANTARYELPGDSHNNSLRGHHMYPPSLSGNPTTSRGGTVSTPSERPGTSPSANTSSKPGPVSPYELPQNRSDEAIRPAPDSDFKLDDQPAQTPVSVASPGPIVSPLARCISDSHHHSEISPVISPTSRPVHHRNTSSLSSGMAQLPSPGSGDEARRSQVSLPSNPNSPEMSQSRFVRLPLDQHEEEAHDHDTEQGTHQSESEEEREERKARQEWTNF